MSKRVFIVHSSPEYVELFEDLGYTSYHDLLDEQLNPVDLIVFTGGSDVTPSLYGHPAHPYTSNSVYRDVTESSVFEKALQHRIPMVGICRGGQFLNVMSGGTMYQHVEGHTRSHEITDVLTGDVVYVSSTHHQMMKPSSKALLVASSTIGGYREWWDGTIFRREASELDYEVVYYEHTNSLCFQPHPEFNHPEYHGMKRYFQTLLLKFFP
jgi:gamma-glutamyl-gamma-aminobutyrate hydrolase PuuD